MTPTVRSAAGCPTWRRRAVNQSSAYTSSRLLAVADGMGGHAHGEIASAVAIDAVAEVDASLEGRRPARRRPAQRTRDGDGHRRAAAHRRRRLCRTDPALRGTGTTLVALLVDGTRIGVGHMGDSRAYLLRDGELHQITTTTRWSRA